MNTIKGQYTTADVMVDNVEQTCIDQLQTICDTKYFDGAKIKIMPDCHAGKGSVIGFTCRIKDKVSPSIVGVDISCSISAYKLNTKDIDLGRFDEVVHNVVPTGMTVNEKFINDNNIISEEFLNDLKEVCDTIGMSYDYAVRSICSLGSGNHFIELDKDKDGNIWLMVHTGSRNLGKRICDYHQDIAIKHCKENLMAKFREEIMSLPAEKRAEYHKTHKVEVPNESLCYLEGVDLDLYTKHMLVAEKFAQYNHALIVHRITTTYGVEIVDSIFTHHNYIEFLGNREMIIRKGAISAYKNERVLIPLNMRDGTIIGVGKGNEDWNCSAPHGAGRVLSRGKARHNLSVDDFSKTMEGIYTTCVCEGTLDESPMAYKDYRIIMDAVGETIDIHERLLPIYNFKATDA